MVAAVLQLHSGSLAWGRGQTEIRASGGIGPGALIDLYRFQKCPVSNRSCDADASPMGRCKGGFNCDVTGACDPCRRTGAGLKRRYGNCIRRI
jgi:hypothetical protein